ncbi:NACHT domain-containing protein [Streptomyces sp. ODS28]|uniref:NACHT domain-containing protein n=1 Tax=Streptomyces sp. ODS28 TaxID=3136688 RepID=UPI0031EE9623
MDAGAVGARLASGAVAPLVKKLFVKDGPGAGLVDKPVRVSGLVSFMGEKRTFTEKDMRKLTGELVERAVREAGPHDPPVPVDEQRMVAETLMHTLHVLGELDMVDVQAVRMGPEQLSWLLRKEARRPLFLSADGLRLHNSLLQVACLHILNFFTQRSTFVARTLVEQSRELRDAVAKLDLLIERIPSRSAEDMRFEEQYADYLARRHGKLTIYGVDLRDEREWPLDTAYLSLEATASAAEPSAAAEAEGLQHAPRTTAIPAEQILTGHDRVLLRGVAGSGKTTLVQWLAVTTARQGELPAQQAHLMGKVPFVLPLRTLTRGGAQLPTPGRFLEAVGCPLTGSQPQGWADRVLAARRALLLIDGIDEVPEQDRERTRRWLADLLSAFPGNLWLVTSRPSAVREDWLGGEDFSELTLSTMKREDIAVFIDRWHAAAGADPSLGAALLEAVRVKPDLGRLATNPLMCGLICALHRERRGFLPRGRKALYDAALSMLLERRDRERDMHREGSPELDEESQVELLQKLAYWLIRNGRSEMERGDAVALVGRVLPSMPYVSGQGDAEAVFRYLLERSGLLREPAPGAVDFIHRTFQDYLGARAAVEERDFDVLVGHAHLDQWEDVVRMAVAHARPDERASLLRKLIARGDGEEEHRARLHLLAMACLEHATKLDPAVREAVEERAAAFIPPRSLDEAKVLAELGPVVLELLPDPAGLDRHEAEAVTFVAAQSGADAALPFLARCHHLDGSVPNYLGGHWDRFDTEAYAEAVITHLVDRKDAAVTVRSKDELAVLRRLGGAKRVTLQGDFTMEEITSALSPDRLRAIELTENAVVSSLEPLRAFPQLENVSLQKCHRVSDLGPLSAAQVKSLHLNDMPGLTGCEGLGALEGVEHLTLNGHIDWPGFSVLANAPGIRRLFLPASARGLKDIGVLPGLERLGLWSQENPPNAEDWHAVAEHPGLTSLNLRPTDIADLAELRLRMERIHELYMLVEREELNLRLLSTLFPTLRHIAISLPGEIDLAPLADLPCLRTAQVFRPARVRNADAVPSTVEVTITPGPRYGPTAPRNPPPPPSGSPPS